MQSRRDVLRMGAGAAAAGGIASLAGCSNIPVVGSYFEDGLDYTDWAYDPEEMDGTSLSFTLVNVESILDDDGVPQEDRDNMSDGMSEQFDNELEAEEIEYQLDIGLSTVLTGSFDASDVLDAMSLSEGDDHGDFDIYESDDEDTTYYATDGDHLIVSRSYSYYDHDGREELELLIDTYNEDSDRFADTNDDFDQLTSELSSGDFVNASGSTEADEEGMIGNGFAASIDGEEVSAELVAIYESEDDIDLEEIKSGLENDEDEDTEVGEPSQDGRLVTVDFTFPTEELF